MNRKLRPRSGTVILAFVAFIALGLPDGLLGVGWPSVHADFSVPLDAIGMFLASGVVGYMASSFLSGFLLSRAGVGRILASSCLLTGSALLGYTLVPQWWMMVCLGIVAGMGAGAIDAGLNTYVAAHFGEGLMQWLHASWGVGITLGPVIMTFGLVARNTWRFGYRAVGLFQIALAAGFVLTLAMWSRGGGRPGGSARRRLTDYRTPIGQTLRQPRVWLSVALFFLYVGAEASLGIWAYALLAESRGMPTAQAGFLTGSYWFSFTIGRISAGMFAGRLGSVRLVLGGLAGAILAAGLLVWHPTETADACAVAAIGLCIAPVFPAMMSGTRARVGDPHAANTIGMQMAATGLGTAVLPGLMGVLARRMSLEVIPVCLLAVYAGLFGLFLLATGSRETRTAAVAGRGEHG